MWVRRNFQGPGYLTFCSLMSWEANPADLSGGSVDQGTEESTEDESQGQESGYSSFVQELLKGAPQEHLPILEPYIKKFDAGVTRRFQDLNSKFKHYEPLGWDEETTQQMAEVYRVLNEEPESMLEALRAALEDDEEQNDESDVSGSDPSIQELPAEWTQRFEQQQQVLEALAQYVLQDHTTKTEAMEDQEYEAYVDLLKQEYGSFDEEYVHGLIANGMDGEAAVKQWQAKEQEIIERLQSATGNLPPALLSSAGGGAVVQQEPQKLGSIPDKDIRNLIANVMSQANQAAQ